MDSVARVLSWSHMDLGFPTRRVPANVETDLRTDLDCEGPGPRATPANVERRKQSSPFWLCRGLSPRTPVCLVFCNWVVRTFRPLTLTRPSPLRGANLFSRGRNAELQDVAGPLGRRACGGIPTMALIGLISYQPTHAALTSKCVLPPHLTSLRSSHL